MSNLHTLVKNIIINYLPHDDILDFNEIINYLPDFRQDALKTHKWNNFVSKDFLRSPTEIKCIICASYFVDIYNSVLFEINEAKTCEEIQIKNILE